MWWRRLAGARCGLGGGEPPLPRYKGVQHNVGAAEQDPRDDRRQHPSPLDGAGNEHDTRVWTFTVVRKPRAPALHAAWQTLWYHGYRKPSVLIATNEKEDLVVFKRERLNLERPQKLGPLDVGLIYFRRHLALRARDYQRLGAARGALKTPPRPATVRAPGGGGCVKPVACS